MVIFERLVLLHHTKTKQNTTYPMLSSYLATRR